MPLSITLPGFRLESISTKDNFLTHYNALNDSNAEFIISEFFPSYMVNRTETGALEIVPRFANEYAINLDKYHELANGMKGMNDASITPVEDVIENNGTIYITRRVNDLPTLSTYMSGKRMDLAEAFLFIRPLLIYLAEASKIGLLYDLSNNNLRVNRYGQMVLDSMFLWDSAYPATIVDIAKLYFQLITGSPYNAATPSTQEYGVTLPPRLETMMKEILSGDMLYGSIDDFFKKFKSLIDTGTGGSGDGEGSAKNTKMSGTLKWVAIGLATVSSIALVYLLNFHLFAAYGDLFPGLANPHLLQPPATMIPNEERKLDFTYVAFANPNDGSDVLNGSFAIHEGTLYYRGRTSARVDCLFASGQDGEERIIVENVLPSFITIHNNYIYFCDVLTGNKIYRVGLHGGETEMISENCALFLQFDGNFLYYTNHDDLDRLYRINLSTGEDLPYLMTAAFESIVDRNQMYFINGNQGFTIFSVNTNETEPIPMQLNYANSQNLKKHNGLLYYLDGVTIRTLSADGNPEALDCPIPAYGFYPIDDWLMIIEAETYHLIAYNFVTGEEVTLSPYALSAYVWAHNGIVYVVDYNNSRYTRTYTLP